MKTAVYHAGIIAACLCFALFLCAGNKRKRPDLGAYTEKTKVDKVSIVVLPNGHVQAMLPMVLSAEQETGPAVPSRTVLNCKAAIREHKMENNTTVTETVLKCGDRIFIVTGVDFTESK